MKKFKKKFEQNIVEIYSCFDRVLFKGHLPISGAARMSTFMKLEFDSHIRRNSFNIIGLAKNQIC